MPLNHTCKITWKECRYSYTCDKCVIAKNHDKEVHIITNDEMTRLKENSKSLLKVLPSDPIDALIVLNFLREHIENDNGFKVLDTKIKMKD